MHMYFVGRFQNRSRKHYKFVPLKNRLKKVLLEGSKKFHKCCFFISDRNKGKKAEEILRGNSSLELAVTSNFCYEVTGFGMNKSEGIRRLADYLGFDETEVIAFGDSENDLEMLRHAGYGVAWEMLLKISKP